MESRSIYKQFYIKLIFATSLFLIILSFIFFEYTKNSFYDNIQDNLLFQAKQIEKGYISFDKFQNVISSSQIIELVENNKNTTKRIEFSKFSKSDKSFIRLEFLMHDNAILQITKDISLEKDILYLIIFKNFFALAIPGFIFMLIYALIVAKSLFFFTISPTVFSKFAIFGLSPLATISPPGSMVTSPKMACFMAYLTLMSFW